MIYVNEAPWWWDSPIRTHYNLWVCLEGEGEMTCGEVTYPVSPWSAFLIPPSMSIAGRSSTGTVRNFTAHWLPRDTDLTKTELGLLSVQIREVDLAMSLIQYLLRIPLFQDAHASRQVEQLILTLLGIVWREHLSPKMGPFDQVINSQVERLRSGQDLFVSVDSLAAEAKLSRMHYTRCFTDLMAISPNRFLIKQRVQRACGLLRDTDWTIDMISSVIGYADAYFFSRQFKRVMGQTPGQYRLAKGGISSER